MKTVVLALAVVALSATAAMAAWPAGVVAPLDGTGVTPTGSWAGGSSLEITGLDSIGSGGTTTAVEYSAPFATDYTQSARLSSNSPSEIGFLARGDLTSGNSYVLTTGFSATGTGGSFNLIKIAGLTPTNILTTTVPWLSSTGQYDVKFSTLGSYLFGRITDVANPTNTTSLYGWDDAYTTGAMGALVTVSRDSEPPPTTVIDGKFLNMNVGATDIMLGDADWNGTVNFSDLNVVLTNYNQTGKTWADGDFNHDGAVNFTDLNIVLTNYNHSVSGNLMMSSSPVPEPSTLGLAIGGLAMLGGYWLRKRR